MTTASKYSDGLGRNSAATSKDATAKDATFKEQRTTPPDTPEFSREIAQLPQRDSPLENHAYLEHGSELRPSQVRLILFPEAIDEIAAHAMSDMHSEVGGVLLGQAYRHLDMLYVDVRSALPVLSDDHGPIHFTFNADSWSDIHRERMQRHANLAIVGWFHTHPGLGVFFSGDDVVVQSAAFVLPWHTALVIDPVRARMTCFAWERGEMNGLPGFFEILSGLDSASRLPWRFQRGEIWNQSSIERLAAEQGVATRQSYGLNNPSPWLAVLGSALAILLSLALLVGGLLPLSSRNEALQNVVASLSDRTIQEANANGSAICPGGALQIYSPLPEERVTYGQEITLVGNAAADQTRFYRLDVRPSGEQTWWQLGSLRRRVHAGKFLTWDTASFAPGAYELRLAATNRAGDILAQPPPCVISFELSAAPDGTS